MSADKRIPVTEERWEQLHNLKRPGQTYDELLEELVQERNRKKMADKIRQVQENGAEAEGYVPLEEA
ncbi:DUF7557 family protein [Halalkalicoccus salilacus]|uniref:DUF7557 family protein n=1 Tax=Halalkalicoccus salilacus TaxID=3117459 RepID=UPI00300F22FD